MVVLSFSESDRHSGGKKNHQDKGKPSTRIAGTIMLRVRSIRLEPRPTLLARGSLSGDFVFLFLRLSPAPPPPRPPVLEGREGEDGRLLDMENSTVIPDRSMLSNMCRHGTGAERRLSTGF